MNFIDIALASKLNGGSGGSSGAVSSVNGKTGNVVLTGADLAFSDSTTYPEGSIGYEISNLDAGSIGYDNTQIYRANTIGKAISDVNTTIANVPQIDNQNEIVLFNKTGLTNGSSFSAEFDYQTIFPTTTEGSIDVQVEYDNKVYNCIALYNQFGYERNYDALESDVFVIIGDLVGYYVSKLDNVEPFYNFPFQIILGPTKTLSTVTCYFEDNQSHNVKLLLPANQLLKRQYLDTASYVYNGSGKNSTREGICTAALDECAHAEGFYTVAAGPISHTEGYSTIACYCAHAEGLSSEAIGNFSHAEGSSTVAKGNYSHAEGFATTTLGDNCHAEGLQTIAKGVSQHVFGEFNIEDPTNIVDPSLNRGTYVEIVGNGTGYKARSNARTLDWSGNETLAGKLTIGTGPTNNMDVATKQYVDNAILNTPITVSGTTPTITASNGSIYICGEVATLDITLPASGIFDIIFESGSTPTVLTVTGVTWMNGFDPTTLEANKTYEINILNGIGVAAWT